MMRLRSPIKAGEAAPDFIALDHTGETVSLRDLYGTAGVALVFYPRDFTPVCTRQMCEMRDNFDSLQKAGWNVAGVNMAESDIHRRFREKHGLPFPILADPGGRIASAYGALWLDYPFPVKIPMRAVVAVGRDGVVKFSARGKPTPSLILNALQDVK